VQAGLSRRPEFPPGAARAIEDELRRLVILCGLRPLSSASFPASSGVFRQKPSPYVRLGSRVLGLALRPEPGRKPEGRRRASGARGDESRRTEFRLAGPAPCKGRGGSRPHRSTPHQRRAHTGLADGPPEAGELAALKKEVQPASDGFLQLRGGRGVDC
jgi:hypothetical protein